MNNDDFGDGQDDGLDGLTELQQLEIQQQADKLQNTIESAKRQNSTAKAEAEMSAWYERFLEENGHQPPIHVIEEKKRSLRRKGYDIW